MKLADSSSLIATTARKGHRWQRLGHVGLALGLTVFLLVFLVFARWLDAQRQPDQVIRMVETAPPVALPAPPPPPSSDDQPPNELPPPPPPPQVELPQLELQIEAVAPPLAARLDPQIDLTMQSAVFDLEVDPPPAPRVAAARPTSRSSSTAVTRPSRPAPAPKPQPAPAMRTTYSSGELDSTPRLINRPSASYPRDRLRAGVKEGRVLLEVSISTGGRVSVRRVLSSTHSDFTAMARTFASRAKFSVPKKDGRPVTAIYRWPLILRP